MTHRGITIERHGRRYRWRLRVAGERVRRTFDSLEKAKAALDELLDARERHDQQAQVREAGGVAVGELVDRWFSLHPNLAPRTRSGYEGYIRLYVSQIAQLDARSLRPMDVQEFLATVPPVGQAHKVRIVLSQAFRWGVENELLDRNPVTHAKAPRVDPTPLRVPTPEEVTAILREAATIGLTWYAWCRVTAATGARRSEVCALTTGDIDVDAMTIRIDRAYCATSRSIKEPKTRAGRRQLQFEPNPATEDLFRLLEEVGKASPTEFLFPAEQAVSQSPCIHPCVASHRFRKTANRAGVAFTPHALRHFVAVEALNLGWPAPEVAAWLGHSRPSLVLDLYGNHVRHENRRRMGGAIASRVQGPEWR